MPKPPGIIDKVNYVVKFLEDPCVAPWTVYIELALPAVGHAAIAYATPTPSDVLRFYIKPRGARSQGKFLSPAEDIAPAERGEHLITDVNEFVGTHLPFADRLATSVVHDQIRWFWVIDGILERLLWYWLLVELVTDVLFDWTTAINQSEACSADLGGSALVRRTSQFFALGFEWLQIEPGEVVKSWGAVHGLTSMAIVFAATTGTLIGGCTITGEPGVTQMQVGLFKDDQLEPIEHRTFNVDPLQGSTHHAAFNIQGPIHSSWTLRIRFERIYPYIATVVVTEAYLNGFGDVTESGLPDQI